MNTTYLKNNSFFSKHEDEIKREESFNLLCLSMASEIVLFHGMEGITQDNIDLAWTHDKYPPSITMVRKRITIPRIKEYIENYILISDCIWNGSFLKGIYLTGTGRDNKHNFETVEWNGARKSLLNILNQSPFFGRTTQGTRRMGWWNVPALSLSYDKNSPSFLAGVLSTGKMVCRHGVEYAQYNKKAYKVLEKYGIPIEYSSKRKIFNLISPIWPALFSKRIPHGEKWLNLRNGCKTGKYAAILWRIYTSRLIETRAIPYLNSRRMVYYKYGNKKKSEQQWLKMGLSQIDRTIIKVVHEWEEGKKNV